MKRSGMLIGGIVGVMLGIVGTVFCAGPVSRVIRHHNNEPPQLEAGNSDRYEDYVICTGAVAVNARAPTDGVWMLDYRAGKLLATVIDRASGGKILGFAELNLAEEFGIPPKQNVHFLMTTGTVAQGQAALYVAETTTGKFGVYTLGPDPSGQAGLVIRRHDMVLFRKNPG